MVKPLFFLFLFLLAIHGCSQGGGEESEAPTTGSLTGRILDSSKKRVEGASILIRHLEKSLNKSTISNGDGDFSFTAIPYGSYQLTINKTLFSDFTQNLGVLPNQVTSVTLTLESSTASSSVTILSGVLKESRQLKTSAGKVLIAGDLLIPKSMKLLASQGVILEFAATDAKNSGDYPDKVEIIVEGDFLASGTKSSPVIFQPQSGASAGSWGQIKFVNASATSALGFVTITGATIGVHAVGGAPKLKSVTISNSSAEGVFLEGSNSSVVSKCTVNENGGDGIRVGFGAQPVINKNAISQNKKSGISLFNSSGNVTENTIERNFSNGVELYFSAAVIASNSLSLNGQNGLYLEEAGGTIAGNIIYSNTSHGIRALSSTTSVINNNYIVQNGGHGINSNGFSRPTITNNLIFSNGGGGYLGDSSQSNIVNNLITANSGAGIRETGSSRDLINQNVIAGNTGDGIGSSNSAPTLRNNILKSNTTGLGARGTTLPTTNFNVYFNNGTDLDGVQKGSGDTIGVDPRLVNENLSAPHRGNFAVATASLIRNKGFSGVTPGLSNPSAVGKLASNTPGFSNLPTF